METARWKIVAVEGRSLLAAFDPEDPGELLWRKELAGMQPINAQEGFSIPVLADVCGNSLPEVIVQTNSSLVVLDGTTGQKLCSYAYAHPSLFEMLTEGRITPVVADIWPGNGRNEIAIVCIEFWEAGQPALPNLKILEVDSGEINVLDSQALPETSIAYFRAWLSGCDMLPDDTREILVSYSWWYGTHQQGVWTYDVDDLSLDHGYTDSLKWEAYQNYGIPAAGRLAGNMRVALSRENANEDHPPAYILDSSLGIEANCAYNPSRESENVLCCMMADWDPLIPGLDRIIAPAENQCFVWSHLGEEAWFTEYSNLAGPRPPFGALSNLDANAGPYADLIVGIRAGIVMAYDYVGDERNDIGFPYTLPSEVYGGFVISDIDNDSKVEVVFGTMDNYLHVWELGSCEEGYAPWPQCQHDAQRTGVLE